MNKFKLIFVSKGRNNRMEDKHKKILTKNMKLLDPILPQNPPMVSIIILNRNGADFLNEFFQDFKENTIYNNYEIIVVDNGSTDQSISILESESKLLPLKIIRNKENKSFSQGCNQGVKHAISEYILLINNDTQPTYGWLNEMVKCALRTPKVGAVCPKILYPKSHKNKSLLVQQMGMSFKKSQGVIRPYVMGNGYKPFDRRVNKEEARIIVSGTVLLVKKDMYFNVGGLDESYNYGHEDVDFSLKLTKIGYKNMYCPTSLVFHHFCGTQFKDKIAMWERIEYNNRVFNDKWGEWLKENYEKICF
jgi:GT2 family glycosyltransferase